jgi:F-type H+-transporting ATPase subunit epsilon
MQEMHGRTGAPAHGSLRVTVVSPEKVVYEGPATALVVPAYDGLVGILPRHAPFLSLLGKGELVVRDGGTESRFRLEGGFVQVVRNVVRVVAEGVTEAA